MKRVKEEYSDETKYELRFQFIWFVPKSSLEGIDFARIEKDSWVVGAEISSKDENE